jgi:hypothetical protein
MKAGVFTDVLPLGWWGFSLAMHFTGFLRCTAIVSSFIGGGETILRALCSSALWQIYQTLYLSLGCRNAVYNSLSGCRNAGL